MSSKVSFCYFNFVENSFFSVKKIHVTCLKQDARESTVKTSYILSNNVNEFSKRKISINRTFKWIEGQTRDIYRICIIPFCVILNISWYWLYIREEILSMAFQLPFRSSVRIVFILKNWNIPYSTAESGLYSSYSLSTQEIVEIFGYC
jgi:hypothetical protein